MKRKQYKITKSEIIAILSTIGIICWLITDFYGGMIIFLLSYALVIVPTIILYLASLIDLVLSIIKLGKHTSKIKLAAHSIVFFFIIGLNLYQSELFKSEKVMSATLKDDLFYYRLVFRENEVVEHHIHGFLGYQETIYGKYKIVDDKIIFTKKPHDNDFLSDTLLIDIEKKAIFTKKLNGEFSCEKKWLNHYEIQYLGK